jgi:gamma-carbonic anhydrase
MLLKHRGKAPSVPASAYVAPSAVICGAVTLGENVRVLHGAVLTAEDGEVRIGADVVIMEHALLRGRHAHPLHVGNSVLIGPHAHLNGTHVEDEVFVATGASLFPGSRAERGSELRINSVLHVNSRLQAGVVLPIGWVAVGDPAKIFSPERHDEIWAEQSKLDFVGTVYGVETSASMAESMRRQSAFYAAHLHDERVDRASRDG